jgi:hypothetical protein
MKQEEEFKVPKSVLAQSLREEGPTGLYKSQSQQPANTTNIVSSGDAVMKDEQAQQRSAKGAQASMIGNAQSAF